MSLEKLQLDITGRLQSLSAFANVPVQEIRPRDEGEALQIQTDLDQALAGLTEQGGKSGATIIVQMPVLSVENGNTPGPDLTVSTSIRVLENPLINMGTSGTQLSAEALGLEVISGLHHWNPGHTGVLYAEGPAMEPNLEFEGLIVYDVTIRCRLGLAQPATAAAPVIAVNSGEATLTSITPGATIRYTLDGTFPGLQATEYSTPVTLGAAESIRAVAYADNLNPSSVTEQQLSGN